LRARCAALRAARWLSLRTCARRSKSWPARLASTAPGQTVAFYHAGFSDAERVDVQARFVSGAIDIIVATMTNFGTGVDMPRVYKVVVYGVPASVHTLVQLVGRGGRAG